MHNLQCHKQNQIQLLICELQFDVNERMNLPSLPVLMSQEKPPMTSLPSELKFIVSNWN